MKQIVELVIELQESVGWINRLSTYSLNLGVGWIICCRCAQILGISANIGLQCQRKVPAQVEDLDAQERASDSRTAL
jgi:hypothetical protein